MLVRETAITHYVNGEDAHWICFHHLNKWNADPASFLADRHGCETEELGELLEGEVYAQPAFISGGKPCASRAADGRCIPRGMGSDGWV